MLILICDDEPMVRIGLKSMLEELEPETHSYVEAVNGCELVEKAALLPDLAFVDVQMPVMDGLSAIEAASETSPATKWFLLTGHSQFTYAQKAVQLGISDYLLKPVGIKEIAGVMEKVHKWKNDNTLVKSYLKTVTDVDFDPSSPQKMALRIQEMTDTQASGEPYADIVSKAKSYVQSHYQNDIGVDSIAGYLNITPNYLSRVFRSQTDVKLIEYLNEVRISKAKNMLNNPNIAIKDVARLVGYQSAKHFSKVFYKIAGTTPSEYQKKRNDNLL